jgi:hypothetical protein
LRVTLFLAKLQIAAVVQFVNHLIAHGRFPVKAAADAYEFVADCTGTLPLTRRTDFAPVVPNSLVARKDSPAVIDCQERLLKCDPLHN